MMKRRTELQDDGGFTIVELMIATLIFSLVLIIITIGVIRFSSDYYRGVYTTATQSTTRSISDNIEQTIQFGTAPVTDSVLNPSGQGYFCAGGYTYAYSLGVQYLGAAPTLTNAGLYKMPMTTQVCTAPPSLSNGEELLDARMRLTYLSVVKGSNNLVNISIKVIYGDNDLICVPSIPSIACNTTSTATNAQLVQKIDAQCKSQKGSEYCATSSLTVTVQKRVGAS
jgi:type II secretory pathway pseudopilin PulG